MSECKVCGYVVPPKGDQDPWEEYEFIDIEGEITIFCGRDGYGDQIPARLTACPKCKSVFLDN